MIKLKNVSGRVDSVIQASEVIIDSVSINRDAETKRYNYKLEIWGNETPTAAACQALITTKHGMCAGYLARSRFWVDLAKQEMDIDDKYWIARAFSLKCDDTNICHIASKLKCHIDAFVNNSVKPLLIARLGI